MVLSPGHITVISTLTPPSADLEISATDNLQFSNVNVVFVDESSTAVNLTNHVFDNTSFDVVSGVNNALRPATFVAPAELAVVHSSVVNNNVPEIVLSGAPVYVTTPPDVVAYLKIGFEIKTLAF